jgi:DNA replication protein DnaC
MELTGEALAGFRMMKTGGLSYKAIRMNEGQRAERISYIRQALRSYPQYCSMSNDDLEDIRLYRVEKGYIFEDADGRESLLVNTGISQEETEFRRVRAMMPFEFMNLTGKDFRWNAYESGVPKGKDMVNDYIMNFERFKKHGMGLYIYSGVKGSGKTMLSCCILNEISKRYPGSVKFVNALDFLEMTKKGFRGDEDEVMSLYQTGLLVIDDIGVQMSKEWVDTVFYRLVNDRYSNGKPTIYTSNIPIDKLKMDDRITDRIESTTYIVKLPEESIRKRERQKAKNQLLHEVKACPPPG